jgi:hypothetical protein
VNREDLWLQPLERDERRDAGRKEGPASSPDRAEDGRIGAEAEREPRAVGEPQGSSEDEVAREEDRHQAEQPGEAADEGDPAERRSNEECGAQAARANPLDPPPEWHEEPEDERPDAEPEVGEEVEDASRGRGEVSDGDAAIATVRSADVDVADVLVALRRSARPPQLGGRLSQGATPSALRSRAVRPSWSFRVASAPRASSKAAAAALPLPHATMSGVSPNWSA